MAKHPFTECLPILVYSLAWWCNGSTAGFGPVSQGSSPCQAAIRRASVALRLAHGLRPTENAPRRQDAGKGAANGPEPDVIPESVERV